MQLAPVGLAGGDVEAKLQLAQKEQDVPEQYVFAPHIIQVSLPLPVQPGRQVGQVLNPGPEQVTGTAQPVIPEHAWHTRGLFD
jgi:hypothetical protein